MLHIPIFRTRRLTAAMRELTIGQSLSLAAMPDHAAEAQTTAFLRFTCGAPSESDILEDPSEWTVEERMAAVANYLAAVADDGPDFALGAGRLSDYLLPETDAPPTDIEAGEVGGDRWRIVSLTGRMAESIERLRGDFADLPGAAYWTLARMAAQLRRAEEMPASDGTEGELDAWLLDRLRVFAAWPESDLMALLLAYESARPGITHLFRVASDASGLIALPREDTGLAPARFPVASCLSEWAQSMARWG